MFAFAFSRFICGFCIRALFSNCWKMPEAERPRQALVSCSPMCVKLTPDVSGMWRNATHLNFALHRFKSSGCFSSLYDETCQPIFGWFRVFVQIFMLSIQFLHTYLSRLTITIVRTCLYILFFQVLWPVLSVMWLFSFLTFSHSEGMDLISWLNFVLKLLALTLQLARNFLHFDVRFWLRGTQRFHLVKSVLFLNQLRSKLKLGSPYVNLYLVKNSHIVYCSAILLSSKRSGKRRISTGLQVMVCTDGYV